MFGSVAREEDGPESDLDLLVDTGNTQRTYLDYVEDMLLMSQKVQSFIAGLEYDDFIQDDKTMFAVIRGLEL